MNNRITPENITELKQNEIFVFGSNLAGRHGRGAAKTAMKWGAIYGQARGLQGRTYGIPTVNNTITNKLSIDEIQNYVNNFIYFAEHHPDLVFLVTKIGCGLAGFREEDVAPLFVDAIAIVNIYLPQSFWNIVDNLIFREE